MTALFPSAYFPSISYLKSFYSEEKVAIELFETYPKQTLRNRCEIATSNGKLRLSVPIKRVNGSKTLTRDIRIDNATSWKKEHWRSIQTAYASAPYFEEYDKEIHHLINSENERLIDLNNSILEFLYKVLDQSYSRTETTAFKALADKDFRNADFEKYSGQKYTQVFAEEHGFIANLSILDLLFNEGPFIRNWIL